jgi:hypothetical protein
MLTINQNRQTLKSAQQWLEDNDYTEVVEPSGARGRVKEIEIFPAQREYEGPCSLVRGGQWVGSDGQPAKYKGFRQTVKFHLISESYRVGKEGQKIEETKSVYIRGDGEPLNAGRITLESHSHNEVKHIDGGKWPLYTTEPSPPVK